MNEYIQRQIQLMTMFIDQYEKGSIDLNALVHKLEGLATLPEMADVRVQIGSLIGDLEEFNAWILDEGNLPEHSIDKLRQKLNGIKIALSGYESKR